MRAPSVTYSKLEIRHEIQDITNPGGTSLDVNDGERTVRIYTVVVSSCLGCRPGAYAIGYPLRKDGQPKSRMDSVRLSLGGPTEHHAYVPQDRQPEWLKQLLQDSLRYLEAAEREMVLNP